MSPIDRALHRVALAGVFVFVVGYGIAVPLYPGGSHFDREHPGFDVADNYLCDAFRARAYNGEANELGARVGQIGMIGLVFAASAALLGAPATFREPAPRVSRFARFVASLAFVGMMLVPLTPAHEYGVLHFAAVGLAAVPSLVAAFAVAFGILLVARDADEGGAFVRALTYVTLVACTLHFAQYAAQVAGVLGESVTVPRAQKGVVTIVATWVVAVARWALARGARERSSAERLRVDALEAEPDFDA